jgi:alkylation response protein AidB-like acyl-CoA dehydrogenase
MSERYQPSRDQVALAHALGQSLASILPLSRLRASDGESDEAWRALRDLGVFAIAMAEDQAGSGLGMCDEALIVLELGRRVAGPAVLATVGAALVGVTGARPWLASRVAAGYRRGERIVIVGDSVAEWLLVRSASGAALFRHPTASRVLDQTLWSSRLLEAGPLGKPLAETDPAQALRLRLIDAAALAGLAQAALEMAVSYAGLREQFGRPIGSFQAVKHRCADMALCARRASDQVIFAALAMDDDRDDAPLQVESAFFVAGSAAIDNAVSNIQIHGAIGFSDEAAPHRLLKRARLLVEIAGGLEAALERVDRI